MRSSYMSPQRFKELLSEIKDSVHGYYVSPETLQSMLVGFDGGQFKLEKPGLVLRGKIRQVEIPDMQRKRVCVSCTWLSQPRTTWDNRSSCLVPKWVTLELPPQSLTLDVEYLLFYPQMDGDRIKMWSSYKEQCHFYKKTDYTTLVPQENGCLTPLWYLPEFATIRRIFLALLNKQ